MNKRLLLLAALTLASSAWADVPPPNTESCHGQQAGAKCTTDNQQDGTCQKATCSRLDYSNGVPPSAVDYECLQCVAGPAPSNAPAASTSNEKGSSCTAMPGASLGLTILVAAWLSRRRSRGA